VSTVLRVIAVGFQYHHQLYFGVVKLYGPAVVFPGPAEIFAYLQITLVDQEIIPRSEIPVMAQNQHHQAPSSIHTRTVSINQLA
jgi:hypothetical protein